MSKKVIQELKAGRIEFKADKQAGIHVGIGKRSFNKKQLLENAGSFSKPLSMLNQRRSKGI